MLVAACPNCGAEIRFQSTVAPVMVCDFCRSLVMRTDDTVKQVGWAATLPDDVSPIQIGTGIAYGGDGYTVIGRLRWQWSGGAWNEWMATGNDGATLWLGEAMGRFMVLRQCDDAPALATEPLYGERLKVGDDTYVIMDVKTATLRGAQGELPYVAPAGATMLNIDLGDDAGRCASVQTLAGETTAYTGGYADLASLKPTNLRAVEGWPMPNFAHV
jgi:hypothetical protein